MRTSSRNSKAPFVMVNKAVLMDETLSVYDKAVYCILCAYADEDSRSCFPSYQTIARKAGCSRRKAISVVAHLEGLGLIEKKEQRNAIGDSTSNLYMVKPMNAPGEQSDENYALADKQQAVLSEYDVSAHGLFKQKQLNETQSSIYCTEAFNKLKEQIEYDYFEENFSDRIGFIDSLIGYMLELRQESRPDIRRLLDSVDSTVIMEFLEEMKGKSFADVRNIGAYIKKSFAEFLREREVLMATLE